MSRSAVVAATPDLRGTLERVAPTIDAQRPFMHLWNSLPSFISAGENTTANAANAARSPTNPDGWYSYLWNLGETNFPWNNSNAGTTFGAKILAAAGDDYPIGGYQNGSYVNQQYRSGLGNSNSECNVYEADLMERYMAANGGVRIIQVWWPRHYYDGNGPGGLESTGGALESSIDASTTSILVEQTPSANRPSGAPDTWPYYVSSASGDYSEGLDSAVSVIYIDNPSDFQGGEWCKITGVSLTDQTVTLTVERGHWGSTATARAAGTKVLVPSYIGGQEFAGAPGAWERSISGVLATDPTRYAGLVQTDEYMAWKIGRYEDIYDTVGGPELPTLFHQDISASGIYNTTDWGFYLTGYPGGQSNYEMNDPPVPYDLPAGTILDRQSYQEHQLTKMANLRTQLAATFDEPWIQGNSLSPFSAVELEMNRLYEQDSRKPDSTTHEFWCQEAGNARNQQQIDAMIGNCRQESPTHHALIWAKSVGGGYAGSASYRRFTYGTCLLAVDPTQDRVIYGGNCAGSAFDNGPTIPNDIFRVHLGTPIGDPDDFDDLTTPYTALRGYGRISGSGLASVWRRDFTQGVVVVNNTVSSYSFTVPAGDYWQVTESGVSGSTVGATVSVPAYDAIFLAFGLDEAGGSPPAAGDILQSVAGASAQGTSASATFGSTPTSGNTLLAVHRYTTNVTNRVVPSGWTEVYAAPLPGQTWMHVSCYTKTSDGTEGAVSSSTGGANVFQEMHLFEVDGTATFDEESSDGGNGLTSASSGSTSTLAAGTKLVLGAVGTSATVTWNATPGGFTSAEETTRSKTFWKTVTSTTAESFTQTWTTTSAAIAVVAVFDIT